MCAGATGLFFGIQPIGTGMSVATMNLFFPGMCTFLAGGLLGSWSQGIKDMQVAAREAEEEGNDASNDDEENNKGHGRLPSAAASLLLDEDACASVADATAIGMLLWLLVFTALSAAGNLWGGFGAFYVQIYGALAYMVLIVALCFDGGKSLTARLCRSKVASWMGEISMSVYLIHVPFMEYFGVFLNAVAPGMITDEDRAVGIGIGLPVWSAPVTVIISYILGVALEKLVAVPTRKLLRAK